MSGLHSLNGQCRNSCILNFYNFSIFLQIRIHALLPYSIVFVLCIVTGLICFKWLPETANKPTPESMEGVIEMMQMDAAMEETLEVTEESLTKKDAV